MSTLRVRSEQVATVSRWPDDATPRNTQNSQIAHSDHALDGVSITSRLVSTILLDLYDYTVCEVGPQ